MRTTRDRIRLGAQLGVIVGAIAFLAATIYAQQATREVLGKTSDKELQFDHDGLDAEGNAIAMDAAEFIFRPAAAAPIRVLISAPIQAGVNSFQAASVIGGVPDGDYDATVRVRATSGNWSEETPPVQVTVTSKKPRAPTNFGVSG